MGKAAGFLLILAGVGTAAYVVPSLDLRDSAVERRTSEVAAITTATRSALPVPSAALLPSAVQAPATTQLVDTKSDRSVAPAGFANNVAPAVAKPSEPIKIAASNPPQKNDQRFALTKEIQRELQRVGCYAGDIDGEWSVATRQAMKTFVDRVNATLPIDAPDHILKTLVSGHPGDACGKACPAGQSAAGGRCVPTPVIAQAPRRTEVARSGAEVPRIARAPAVQDGGATAPPAKPSVTASAPARDRTKEATESVVSSWAPTVVAAPGSSMPAPLPRPAPVVTASVPSEPRAELPGRMAVGVGAPADLSREKSVAAEPSPVLVAPAPKAASRIVIKKRDGAPAVTAAGAPPAAPVQADTADANPKAAARQQTAAIKANEPSASDAAPIVSPPPRVAAKRPEQRQEPRQVIVQRALPPPRFVGVYVSPPAVYRERSTFGPSMFKRFERDAR